MLRYISSRRCFTISMGPHRARPTAAMVPGSGLRKLPLPSASHLALVWEEAPGEVLSGEEQEWLRGCVGEVEAPAKQDEAAHAAKGLAALQRRWVALLLQPEWPAIRVPGCVTHAWLNAGLLKQYPP